jgi:anti-anti-sigma factor
VERSFFLASFQLQTRRVPARADEDDNTCTPPARTQLSRAGNAMIRAQEQPSVLTLDVEGPATMIESPAVGETAAEHVARGVRAVRVDLRGCTMMDSTFSGTLLSLKRQLEKVGGSLTLVSPSRRVLEVLADMGLEDFYAIDTAERPAGTWTLVPSPRPLRDTLARRVLDAHDELARTPGPAQRGFGRVADELRRGLENGRGGTSDPPPRSSRPHLH